MHRPAGSPVVARAVSPTLRAAHDRATAQLLSAGIAAPTPSSTGASVDDGHLSEIIHQQSLLISKLLKEKKLLVDENADSRRSLRALDGRVQLILDAVGLTKPASDLPRPSTPSSHPVDPLQQPSILPHVWDTTQVTTIAEDNVRMLQELQSLTAILAYFFGQVDECTGITGEALAANDTSAQNTEFLQRSIVEVHELLSQLSVTMLHAQEPSSSGGTENSFAPPGVLPIPIQTVIEHYTRKAAVREIIIMQANSNSTDTGSTADSGRPRTPLFVPQSPKHRHTLSSSGAQKFNLDQSPSPTNASSQITSDLQAQVSRLMSENLELKKSTMKMAQEALLSNSIIVGAGLSTGSNPTSPNKTNEKVWRQKESTWKQTEQQLQDRLQEMQQELDDLRKSSSGGGHHRRISSIPPPAVNSTQLASLRSVDVSTLAPNEAKEHVASILGAFADAEAKRVASSAKARALADEKAELQSALRRAESERDASVARLRNLEAVRANDSSALAFERRELEKEREKIALQLATQPQKDEKRRRRGLLQTRAEQARTPSASPTASKKKKPTTASQGAVPMDQQHAGSPKRSITASSLSPSRSGPEGRKRSEEESKESAGPSSPSPARHHPPPSSTRSVFRQDEQLVFSPYEEDGDGDETDAAQRAQDADTAEQQAQREYKEAEQLHQTRLKEQAQRHELEWQQHLREQEEQYSQEQQQPQEYSHSSFATSYSHAHDHTQLEGSPNATGFQSSFLSSSASATPQLRSSPSSQRTRPNTATGRPSPAGGQGQGPDSTFLVPFNSSTITDSAVSSPVASPQQQNRSLATTRLASTPTSPSLGPTGSPPGLQRKKTFATSALTARVSSLARTGSVTSVLSVGSTGSIPTMTRLKSMLPSGATDELDPVAREEERRRKEEERNKLAAYKLTGSGPLRAINTSFHDAYEMPPSYISLHGTATTSALAHLHQSKYVLVDASKRVGYLHHRSTLPHAVAARNQTLVGMSAPQEADHAPPEVRRLLSSSPEMKYDPFNPASSTALTVAGDTGAPPPALQRAASSLNQDTTVLRHHENFKDPRTRPLIRQNSVLANRQIAANANEKAFVLAGSHGADGFRALKPRIDARWQDTHSASEQHIPTLSSSNTPNSVRSRTPSASPTTSRKKKPAQSPPSTQKRPQLHATTGSSPAPQADVHHHLRHFSDWDEEEDDHHTELIAMH